jgi:Mg2+ and Co2+ transporter CorA
VLKYAGGADVLIENSASIICEYNKYITNNDDQFFIQLNVRNEVSKKGGVVKDSDNFIYSLIDSVREHYLKSTTKEKQDIFKEINVLLQCSARYLSGEK